MCGSRTKRKTVGCRERGRELRVIPAEKSRSNRGDGPFSDSAPAADRDDPTRGRRFGHFRHPQLQYEACLNPTLRPGAKDPGC